MFLDGSRLLFRAFFYRLSHGGVPLAVIDLDNLFSAEVRRQFNPSLHSRPYTTFGHISVYTGLPELTYPLHDLTANVTHCGRICLHRKKINLSTVFAGQAVGLKEVEEGTWLVSFMDYDLGYIDLEERTLQPLDNPFGPRVSPM
jgi:hypothetical protein